VFEKIDFKNIVKNSTATGLEVVLLPEGNYEMNVVVVKKKKAALSIESKIEGIKSIDELSKMIDKNHPLVLVINGKGILHRKVTLLETDTPETILNKVLPNATIEEFVMQRIALDESQAFISVIRANALNELTESLKRANLVNIAECLLGPFVVNNVVSLLDQQTIINNRIQFDKYQIQTNGQQITELSIIDPANTNEKILIEGEYVSSKLLLPFAAAVSYFVGNTEGVLNSENINILKEEQAQKRKFELTGWVALIAIFVVLLINYFTFNHYWKKSQDINSLFTQNESALQHYEALKAEYERKKGFLEQNGLLENSRTSFYADELAASLPESIQWLDVNICPVKKKQNSEEDKGIYFENRIITISGKCRRSADLNDWIKQIKKNVWINSTSLVAYKQDNANEAGLFLIKMELKK